MAAMADGKGVENILPSSRIRFMIMDLCDLRRKNWFKDGAVNIKGPQKPSTGTLSTSTAVPISLVTQRTPPELLPKQPTTTSAAANSPSKHVIVGNPPRGQQQAAAAVVSISSPPTHAAQPTSNIFAILGLRSLFFLLSNYNQSIFLQ